MAMKDRSSWQVGPSGDFINTETINCDNPLLSDQQRSLICRTGNFVGEIPALDANGQFGAGYRHADAIRRSGDGRDIFSRMAPDRPAQYRRRLNRGCSRHKSIRLLGGFKGELGSGVSYDASYLFGRVSLDRQYRNNLSISRMSRALDVVSDPSTGNPSAARC